MNELKKAFMIAMDGITLWDETVIAPTSSCSSWDVGVCKLEEDGDTLTVHCRRPGILIGKRAENIGKISTYIGCKIKVIQVNLVD